MTKGNPKWFPMCPWPESIWPMTDEDYVKAIPDPKMRTAISGYLMRKGWEIACEDIAKKLEDQTHD